jgi:transcriptional regulator with XRE-family HTH domain
MPSTPDARRTAFARFVQRAVDDAKLSRGWTVRQIAERAGNDLSYGTIYRWLKGDWREDPKAGQVQAFCNALDIPPAAAFGVLWPGKADRMPVPEPLPLEGDMLDLARRLRDPNVPEAEKVFIRETVRMLAARSRTRTG